MNSDATEAALGLLGLSPLNASQPQPHPQHHVVDAHGPCLTSTSVGIAIDQSSTPHIQSIVPPSIVPLKRKQPSPAATPKSRQPPSTSSTPPVRPNHSLQNASTKPSTTQRIPFSPILTTPPTSQLPLASPSTSHHPLALSDVPPPPDSDAISCICGFTYDDGFSIACDDCSRWCHAACFGIIQGGEVPEFWKCWVCDPTVEVDKERAVKIQKGRLRTVRMKASQGTNGATPVAAVASGSGTNPAVDEASGGPAKPVSRRKASPGAERKSRRGSAVAAAIEGSGSSRKKRRTSMLSPADPSSSSILSANHSSTQPHIANSRISHPNGNSQATSSGPPPMPVTFPPDLYPNPSVYAQLLRVAKAWRGVTALNPPSPLVHPPKTYIDRGYARVDSQGYRDRYGYSMSPLDNTTPVILDENAGDTFVPRTILRTDPPVSCSFPSSSTTCTPAHLRPPSPRLHVASDPLPFPNTSIYPSPPTSHYMSPCVPSSSHPPSYTKSPLTPSTTTISSPSFNNTIPATTLLAPFTTSIVPSAAYLADPLNGYAHLGMGKPQVRLVGGGWGVGLDARGVGGDSDLSDSEKGNKINTSKEDVADGKAKWARCGCWPNAVVRPVICGGAKGRKGKRKGTQHKPECAEAAPNGAAGLPRTMNGRSTPTPTSRTPEHDSSDQDDAPAFSDDDTDSMSLSFALFALRDLRADEEIVLGWEWDDGHAVHMLPALMESPGLFAPAHLRHLRAQFTSILHALSSTFTTCACGSSTRDCAVRVMERVVEGQWPWPGGDMTSEGSEGESSDVNGASGGEDGDVDVEGDTPVDPHPSRNLGLGMNMDVDIEITSIEVDDKQAQQVRKHKVRKRGKVENVPVVEGGKDESAAVPVSTLKSKVKKAIDLGPLVGVKRGFRTREKMPMNGGWGGVEIVPSYLKAFPPVSEEDVHVDGKGKEKERVADGKDDDMDVDPSPSSLPPRMRKAWSRPTADQLGASQGNKTRDHFKHAENRGTHERWRSPPDPVVDSPTSAAGFMEGIDGYKQSSVGVNGDGEDAAYEQETESDTETEDEMPPPPMPASLDPTTISSLAYAQVVRSLSPRDSVQWDKNSVSATWVPPRASTPTFASPGQANQSSSEGTSTAAPVPPLPPQSDSATPTPTLSFPPATEVQAQPVQSLPTPPVPSVSPSAPFSQLSLHSPDASSSPHPSTLLGPLDSILLSSASASKPTSGRRVTSPPPHRPSKPLHVHPHNEPPFPAPLAVPTVMPSSPDGIRDTPAEGQYQQPYRSSPESPSEAHPPSDAEKRHPSNGEHRVRFASPEVLNGLPRLKGKTTLDKSEPLDTDGGVLADSSSNGVNERDIGPVDHDVMDVDVDVVGDDQMVDGTGPLRAASPESKTDPDSMLQEDEYSSLPVPGSPCSQLPPTISTTNGADPENEILSRSSDAHETTPQPEPLGSDHEPAQPQPKVKMSLKDFALRRKKQREEELAAKALRSPVMCEGPELPSSPNIDVKQDLAIEQSGFGQIADSGCIANGHGMKMNDVTMEDPVDSSGTVPTNANGLDGGVGYEHDGRREVKATTEDEKLSAKTQVPSAIAVAKIPDTMHPPPQPKDSSRVLERSDADIHLDGKPPTTLTAKIEMMEAVVPSGLVGADDRTPDVVSFAPEPPPPPSGIKQVDELMIADDLVPVGSLRRSAPPSISSSASTPTPMSTSSSISAGNSRSNSVGILNSTSNPPPRPQIPTPSSSVPSSRRPSHEDGEITSSLPSKGYLPRSHTPPTQPRSFHGVHPPSPSVGSTSSTAATPRRPPPPLSRSPLSNGNAPPVTPISSRPLPSGPRALRGSMSQPTHPPSYSSSRPPYTGSQYIPRGPSADRDRIDWERGDRQWAQVRSRGRAGSNGWGR